MIVPRSFTTEDHGQVQAADPVFLLTYEELGSIPYRTKLTTERGEILIVGVDQIPLDVNDDGYLRVGLRRSQFT